MRRDIAEKEICTRGGIPAGYCMVGPPSRLLFEKYEIACGGRVTHMAYVDVLQEIAIERIRTRAKKGNQCRYQKEKSVAKAMYLLFEHKDVKELYYIFQLLEERTIGLEAHLGRVNAGEMVKRYILFT